MLEIRLPKLNNNDGSYTLIEWYFGDGDLVSGGAVVALVETSKSAEDMVAPADGVLHRAIAAMAECRFGEVIGYVFGSEDERSRFVREQPVASAPAQVEHDLILTDPARELVERLQIDLGRLRGLGKRVIKRSDVESLVDGGDAGGAVRYPLSRQQRAVADVVSRSHASIPAAFTAMWVDATRVGPVRDEVRAATGRTVGVPELLVMTIASLRVRYPLFFGAYGEDHTVVVPAGANVGVTVDAGHGLYLPVLADAARLSIAQIADAVADFQAKARRGMFRECELTGANIGLSLSPYTDVYVVAPIVFPGTSCMLSVSSTHHEPAGPRGEVPARPRFSLGIAYDHRVVNGRDAVIFLREIKSSFERAGRLSLLVKDATASRVEGDRPDYRGGGPALAGSVAGRVSSPAQSWP